MAKGEKSLFKSFLNILVIAIVVVVIIITFGWFFRRDAKKQQKKTEDRIKEVRNRISELQIIKEKLEQRKKYRLLAARIIIGFLFITANFFHLYKIDYTSGIEPILNSILTINGAILMGYSFVAFISYGTIPNFTSALKMKIVYILEKNHIDSIEELQLLEKEHEMLVKKLEEENKKVIAENSPKEVDSKINKGETRIVTEINNLN